MYTFDCISFKLYNTSFTPPVPFLSASSPKQPLSDFCHHRLILLIFILFIYFYLFRAAPAAYGDSQARGPIGAIATGLHHSHSNSRSKLCLQPTPTAHGNAGSLTQWARPGIEPRSSWMLVRFASSEPWWNSCLELFLNLWWNKFISRYPTMFLVCRIQMFPQRSLLLLKV